MCLVMYHSLSDKQTSTLRQKSHSIRKRPMRLKTMTRNKVCTSAANQPLYKCQFPDPRRLMQDACNVIACLYEP